MILSVNLRRLFYSFRVKNRALLLRHRLLKEVEVIHLVINSHLIASA